MLKHSKQREAIRLSLHSRYDHPTADVMYREMRDIFPNISLGTVYRNLSLLCELGEARMIITADGLEHFDGRLELHDHFRCRECGCLKDMPASSVPEKSGAAAPFYGEAFPDFDGIIESRDTIYTGVCGPCSRKS